jgi:hypothetical protein
MSRGSDRNHRGPYGDNDVWIASRRAERELHGTAISVMRGGADPLVRAGPPGPASFDNEIRLVHGEQADEGVGCGPGGPPHSAHQFRENEVTLGIAHPTEAAARASPDEP